MITIRTEVRRAAFTAMIGTKSMTTIKHVTND